LSSQPYVPCVYENNLASSLTFNILYKLTKRKRKFYVAKEVSKLCNVDIGKYPYNIIELTK